ncbi:FG-GAP-like repeat-containing protein [Streptomyces sp. NBC_00289]|uniref:FG-GAP-like repeat-containing protein n=1 Tax=Streptomyces sp. NBC_00289 TaxID=2975703 RepID=UPI00324F59A7
MGLLVGVVPGVVFSSGAWAVDGPPVAKHPVKLPAELPQVAGAKAGFLAGSGGVGPGGAFTYRVPLSVPAGRAGVEPGLSLNYSSAGHDGVFGLGWSASGMSSSISRCGKNPEDDGTRSGVHYDKNDRFCLDGARLVGVDAEQGTSGDYGADGTVYNTAESSFAKIVSVNDDGSSASLDSGPDKFVVAGKNGLISTYEAQTGVRVGADSATLTKSWLVDREVTATTPGPPKPDGSPGTPFTEKGTVRDKLSDQFLQQHSDEVSTPRVVWLLKKMADRNGNEMRYSYDVQTSLLFGNRFLPKAIDYTFGPGRQAERSVEFGYESRPDPTSSYVAGVRYSNTQRLKTIKMFAPNPGKKALVRTYNLSYLGAGTADHDKTRSLLWRVQECGALSGCLPFKEFDWFNAENRPSFDGQFLGGTWHPAPASPTDGDTSMDPVMSVQDLDGDGVDDILTQNNLSTGRGVQARLGVRDGSSVAPLSDVRAVSGVGAFPPVEPQGANPGLDLAQGRPLDSDGDGKTEFMVRSADLTGLHEKVLHWNQAKHEFESTGLVFDDDGYYSNYADVNGDGLVDRIAADVAAGSDDPDNRRDLSVRLNKGDNHFANRVDSTIKGKCPGARIADVDGDGRADMIIDTPLLVKDRNGKYVCGVGFHTNAVHVDDQGALKIELGRGSDSNVGDPGWKFPPLAPQHPEWEREMKDLEGHNVPPFPTADENGVYGWHSYQADLNGDGLKDTLLMGRVPGYHDVILWNTGEGLFWDGKTLDDSLQIDHDAIDLWQDSTVQIADVNKDGRDDVVTFAKTGTSSVSLLLSKGDGTFDLEKVAAGPMDRIARLGDFNGDGNTDILKAEANQLELLTQTSDSGTRITKVRDEGAGWNRESVTYSSDFSDQAGAGNAECDFPLMCVHRGMTVVRQVTSREGSFKNASENARSVFYSYRDPVAHVRQGGLGFGQVSVWDPTRPSITVTNYDLRTTKDGGKHYPFASLAKNTMTATPVLTQNQVNSKVASATARVTRVANTPEFRPLDGGKTFAVFPKTSSTQVWEQNVSLDWDAAASSHVGGLQVPDPADVKRQVDSTTTFDDYGNQTDAKSVTVGGAAVESHTDYDLSPQRQQDWLTGLPSKTTVQRTEHGSTTPVVRVTGFTHDDLGRRTAVNTEPDNTEPGNADLRSSVKTDYTGLGMVSKVTATTPGRPDRVTHTEYAPAFSDQPDEGMFVSQVWSEHSVAAHRPSVWQAMHPAFGFAVASEDVNGVDSTVSSWDDLGRPLTAATTGRPSVTTAYSAHLDAGNITGTEVKTTSTDGGQAVSVSDPAGRPRTSSVKGFNGTASVSVTDYDLLGRVFVHSRPSTAADPYDGSSGVTVTTFDSLDRPIQTESPDHKSTVFTYPSFFTSQVQSPRGNTTRSTVDVDGRPVSATAVLKNKDGSTTPVTTTYTYPRLQAKATDTKGNVTTSDFDILGRTVKYTDPDRGTSTTQYFGSGEVRQSARLKTNGTDAIVSSYDYDDLGRQTTVTDTDKLAGKTLTTSFVWDTAANGSGQMASATSPDQVTTAFGYDTLGRLETTNLSVPTGATTKTLRADTTYDSLGRVKDLIYPAAGASRMFLTTGYNASGYPETVTDTTPGQSAKQLWKTTGRNADLSLATATVGPNALNRTQGYDTTGRLTDIDITKPSNGTKILDLHYTFHPDGMVKDRIQDDPTAKRGETFDYDSMGRLTNWTLANATDPEKPVTYSYDTIGNLTGVTGANQAETRTIGRPDGTLPHALTARDKEKFVYDDLNRIQETNDEQGSQATTTYTPFDLPRTQTFRGDTTPTTYLYDAFGTRVSKSGPNGTTLYAGKLFEQRTDKNNKTSYIHYLTGPDGPIGQAVTDTTGTTIQYTHADHLGSTNTVTDATGTIQQTTYNDPYGGRIKADGTPDTTPLGTLTRGFTGHEHDNPAQINMNGRIYNASAKTFLTPDPVTTNHPYTYVNSNPLNATDPTGYDDLATYNQPMATYTADEITVTGEAIDTSSTMTINPCASIIATGPACGSGNTGSDSNGYTTVQIGDGTNAVFNQALRNAGYNVNPYGGPDGDFSPAIGPLETGEALSPVQTELENANARVGFSGDNRLIGTGPMWVTEGANYAFVWRVGSIEAGDTAESKMGVMQEDPNAIFPFTVQPVDPSTHQSWDSGLPPASARRVRVGNEYNLYNVETESVVAPKGWLPTISNSPVRVISATPTSFTFVTLPGHIDGPGAHVSFSTFSSGDDVLLMQRGYAPGASRVVTTVQPLSLYGWAWRTQARNLAGYPNGPTGLVAVDYSHEPFVNH